MATYRTRAASLRKTARFATIASNVMFSLALLALFAFFTISAFTGEFPWMMLLSVAILTGSALSTRGSASGFEDTARTWDRLAATYGDREVSR